jgi:RNA polymerase sigma factor (sigma-70 family)
MVKGALYIVTRLGVHYARRHRLNQREKAELMAVGSEALTEAAVRYDPSRDTDYEQFVWKRVAGAMQRALKHEGRYRALAAGYMLERFDCPPDPDSPSRDSDEQAEARVVADCADLAADLFTGLTGPMTATTGEEEIILRETYTDAIQTLKEGLATLDADEAALIDRRYSQSQSWPVVARDIGMSESTAKRREADALAKLRAYLVARGCGTLHPPRADSLAYHARTILTRCEMVS